MKIDVTEMCTEQRRVWNICTKVHWKFTGC